MTGTSRPCQRYSRGPAKLKDGFRIMFRLLHIASELRKEQVRWRKLKSGVSRRCCRDFNVFSSSQRMGTVLPRSVTTLCAESANRCTNVDLSLLNSRPKRPKFAGFRSPPTTTRRSHGAGDFFQRFGSVPWHLESMNKCLSRCQTAALGALMS